MAAFSSSGGSSSGGWQAPTTPKVLLSGEDQDESERLHDVEAGMKFMFETAGKLRGELADLSRDLADLRANHATMLTWTAWFGRLHQWMTESLRNFPWH
jgi:hypothetical protein